MQTTLLGLAIALILALTTALVGPLFVDWTRYRSEFEAYASRFSGLEIHITGPIDARLLPTPTLVMQGIEIARADTPGSVRAQALRLEFELAALARGDWRVSEARLQRPEISVGLDEQGRFRGPVPKLGVGADAVAIQRLRVEGGRVILSDASSGSRLVLESLAFTGEVRSLLGPVKGDGSFVVAGQHLPYRVTASRGGSDDALKLRLTMDPIDPALTADIDVTVSLHATAPSFAGQIQVTRPVGRAPTGSPSPIMEPWRLTSRLEGDSARVDFDEIEYQYGPDERATKLRGSARLSLGHNPRIAAELTSPQVDLDGLGLLPQEARPQPLAAFKLLAGALADAPRIPIPADLKIRIDGASIAGATLQRVAAEIERGNDHLLIRSLSFRAPGATQMDLSGRLTTVSAGQQFEGKIEVQTNDPRPLLTWLAPGNGVQIPASGPLHLEAGITTSGEAIGIEELKLDVDRMHLRGSLRYGWRGEKGPARLDAALSASEVDLDGMYALGKAMLGNDSFAWPRQGALSLKAERAIALGVVASQVDVKLGIDPKGLNIDPLIVRDFGGTAFSASGRIDLGSSPRGAVTLDVNARKLDGVMAVVERFAPELAEQLRHDAGRVVPAVLRASLNVGPGAGAHSSNVRLKLEGRAGAFGVMTLMDLNGAADLLDLAQFAAAGTKVDFSARVDADDGEALGRLLRLDRFVSIDRRPGRLEVAGKGSLRSELDLHTRLSVGELDISANGRIDRLLDAKRRADLALALAHVNFRSPRPAAGERTAEAIPATLSMRVKLGDGSLGLSDIAGKVAGAEVKGRLVLSTQQPFTVQGEINSAALDLPAAIAAVVGIPARPAGESSGGEVLWPSEPFAQMLDRVNGEIAVSAAHLTGLPRAAVHDFKGVVRLGEGRISMEIVEGALARGRVGGELVLLQQGEGIIARSHVRVVDANAADLIPGGAVVAGRLRLDVAAEGSGRSALALIGSLEGTGTFTIENARVARLDPKAFEVLIRAVDQGLPIDPNRLRDRMDSALAAGVLSIPRAEGTITIAGGQARLSNAMIGERGSELAVTGSVNLADGSLNARAILSSATAADAAGKTRPEIAVVLRGPLTAPHRSIEVGSFANWLALRAVEQSSTKLEVLESGGAALSSPEHPEQTAPDRNSHPADGVAAPPAANPSRHRANARNAQRPKPSSGELGQPLAPPINARPAIPQPWLFGVQ